MGSRVDSAKGFVPRFRAKLLELYEGETPAAHRFRYGQLIFDVVTIAFIVATSFAERTPLIEAMDIVFGLAILAEFAARMIVCEKRWRELINPATLADMVAII